MAKKPTYEELEQRINELVQAESERKRIEEALLESEESLAMAQEVADIGSWDWKIEDDTLAWSDKTYQQFGLEPGEISPTYEAFEDFVHPDDLGLINQRVEQALNEDNDYSLDVRMIRKDGTEWIMHAQGEVYRDKDGEAIRFIGTQQDITERKKLEEELNKHRRHLENLVEKRTAELSKSNEQLQREIEERKRGEENLIHSRDLMDYIISHAQSAIAVHDRNLNYTYVSKRYLEEYKVTEQNVIGKHHYEVFPDLPQKWREVHQRSLAGEVLSAEEDPYFREDGSVDWTRWECRPWYESDGSIGGIIIYTEVINERKQTEEALRESEAFLKTLIDAIPTPVFYKDRDGKYLGFNRAFETFFGETKERLIGKSVFDINPPELAEIYHTQDDELFNSGGVQRYESQWKNAHGELRDFIFNKSVFTDNKGAVTGLIGVLIDITEHKQTEAALQESEEKYRSMMEAMTEPVYICSPDFRVEYMNPAMIRRIGRDATGEHCFKALHDMDEKCPWCMHDKAQQSEYLDLEIVSPKDNRSYHISQSPVAHVNGSVSRLTVFRDITEMRETEAQLYRAQKMEAMGLLAGGVAHDLNNILSGIVSYPELLLMDLPEDSPLKKPIKTIQESGMRAADVVADLLTIARGVATGKETLNLNTIVTEYLESPEYQKLDKTHSFVNFETELDPDLLNMSGSPIHIKKTLMNLVINASEAIEGRGTVTISSMNRYLDEPLKGYTSIRTGEYAVLSVSDDGFGIAPKDLEKIFEPFYTKKVMGRSGTGLGLAVVWNTVQDHNGYINVESSKQGTVFELYFPVTRKDVSDEKEKTPFENYLGHGEKLLVVDDEEGQRVVACGILTKLGYMAEAVSSGEEAIEYVKENAVDLIVLDMVMAKGINGRETYEQIIKIRPGQKAVIASGYAKTKEVDMAQELGAGKYIKKPYTLAKIGVAVKKELEK
jgi:two-component system, cell cycle sensor histidine kinase and response regulator CckA